MVHLLTIPQHVNSPDNLNQSISIWIPLLSSITGGLLVLSGQFFDRLFKRKSEKKDKLIEIYAFCRRLEAVLKNNYRELAMLKTHVEYWWFCYNLNLQDRSYYDAHLRCQAEAREIERQIGENKAAFISHVRKFQVLKQFLNKDQIEAKLEVIADLVNSKAKSYSSKLSYEEVRDNLVEVDERELRETYYVNLNYFKEINDALELLIN